MAEYNATRVWMMRGCYLALCLCAIFASLLPLQTSPDFWIGPDIMLALTFAWAIRRPEFVPVISVAFVFLLADLLFQRPPGVVAALTVLAVDVLHRRALVNRDMFYVVEWITVAGLMIGLLLAQRVVHAIFILPQASFPLSLMQLGMTIAVYPLIVLLSQFIFGVRRPAPGEVDALGHRL